MRQEKNVDLLLEIWKIVEETHNDWNLIIVGDGPDFEALSSLKEKLGLKHCEFKGWQKNPSAFMCQSRIITMTSQYEGFPLVLVEASQFGVVPVVINSFAAASDIIENNVNGILVEPFNIDVFAQELIKLMNNPNKLNEMSSAAKENASRYDLSAIMEQWCLLINDVINNYKR